MKSLKLLASVLLLIGVSGCESKFPSRVEAQNACEEWDSQGEISDGDVRKGKWEMREDGKSYFVYQKNREARACVEEKETNQFLGYENPTILDRTWVREEGWMKGAKVMKHFRY